MSTVRKIEPTNRDVDVKRAAPLTHSRDRFLEGLFPRRWMETLEPFGWRWPMGIDLEHSFRLDILDRDKELLVRAELPGVEKDDVEVTISGDYLTIEASREFEEEEKQETFYRSELGYGKLVRTVAVPVEVDVEKVAAELKGGILTIRLPKVRAAERHKVDVA